MKIHYVHDSNVDTNDPILRKIMEFCENNDIDVTLRSFEPAKYLEDKSYIARLPAIQVYKRNRYEDTIYPDSKPLQFLQTNYDKYQLEEYELEAKKQIWELRINYLKSVFHSLKTDSKPAIISYK